MDFIDLSSLAEEIAGTVSFDRATLLQYATDASIYRKIPMGVVLPESESDVVEIVRFASQRKIALIPRAAGTSLAGQVVGDGLIVDFSRMNAIIEVDEVDKWARVQPGVIRDELNHHLRDRGLFFSPNTSTANRCMIGGMVGNNSCGTTSIKYGITRDKILEVNAVLADGSIAVFKNVTGSELADLQNLSSLVGKVYRGVVDMLSGEDVKRGIREGFPKPEIHRRNTGYALDSLIAMQPFEAEGAPLNLSKLIAGSEGTLCAITSVKIQLDDLPPPEEVVVCAHFHNVGEALRATVIAMKNAPYACELMDGTILELTKRNPEQVENRFFVQGDPGAILCVEMRGQTHAEVEDVTEKLIADLSASGLGYVYPTVHGSDTARVWALRAAGLGVLSNMPGDAKPVAFIEDTAVALNDLPNYIADFEKLMGRFGKQVVYYAHAGAGELHLRPVLNLKDPGDRKLLRDIAEASADLVAKYGGSLSGEHGDGRVRAEFIERMVGADNYALFRSMKKLWDPEGLYNPGKIVDADPMDTDLRYEESQEPFAHDTFLDFSGDGDMLGAAERCNGSGDCRKLSYTGASMCPSYQATRNEKDSTRARANVLREAMTRPLDPKRPLVDADAMDVLDLCLSCKACQRECPSNVDMALLKAETLFQYQETEGYSKSAKFFGNFSKSASRVAPLANMVNAVMQFPPLTRAIKRRYGIAPERSLPRFSAKRASRLVKPYVSRTDLDFILYLDEFTEFQDAHIAEAAAKFFHLLGYRFNAVYAPSGRPPMSKGMLKEAREAARGLMRALDPAVEAGIPVVGLEPSALLGMRDDLPKLLRDGERVRADALKAAAFTFEEYTVREMKAGRIKMEYFDDVSRAIHLHTHCHQKSVSHVRFGIEMLGFPSGHHVVKIPSGCCGMAGSFGYEADHYEVSMKIGELVLFPRVRNLENEDIVVTSGTSCRHQIADGTGVKALHPAEVMLNSVHLEIELVLPNS